MDFYLKCKQLPVERDDPCLFYQQWQATDNFLLPLSGILNLQFPLMKGKVCCNQSLYHLMHDQIPYEKFEINMNLSTMDKDKTLTFQENLS